MHEKLIERLNRIRESISKDNPGLARLEALRDEARAAFEAAIGRVSGGVNYREELARRGVQLRQWRIGFFRTIFPVNYKYLASAPFIYGMFFPMAAFHICLEVYHHVCFRLYSIPRVKAREYFVTDRQLLPYLNWFEKLNCIYCSYYNNLIRYAGEIGGRTERYWCPIKYARRMEGTHSQYALFVDYLDGEHFREKAEKLRDFSDISQAKPEKCDFTK